MANRFALNPTSCPRSAASAPIPSRSRLNDRYDPADHNALQACNCRRDRDPVAVFELRRAPMAAKSLRRCPTTSLVIGPRLLIQRIGEVHPRSMRWIKLQLIPDGIFCLEAALPQAFSCRTRNFRGFEKAWPKRSRRSKPCASASYLGGHALAENCDDVVSFFILRVDQRATISAPFSTK